VIFDRLGSAGNTSSGVRNLIAVGVLAVPLVLWEVVELISDTVTVSVLAVLRVPGVEYENYKTEDATFAVDYLKVDWNQQAIKSAKSYLDYTSFSLEGLIEQLQYEGFTHDQAAYGANKAY
jgi:hypothetical protein